MQAKGDNIAGSKPCLSQNLTLLVLFTALRICYGDSIGLESHRV